MFSPDQYELLDFGDGRRLERFGPLIIDRPAPAVESVARANADLWRSARARFERTDNGKPGWVFEGPLPEPWTIARGAARFELKPTPAGQVGLFPEQDDNWNWIAERAAENSSGPFCVLNLFGYTGASTLAAAAAGAEVVHVDAAGNIVDWARRNATLSGLADKPIRWINEDAPKFVKRELRRGNRYQAVILDPPSYGHGRRGEVWRLSKHLPRLLQLCGELTAGQREFLLLTCHTPGYGPERLADMMTDALGDSGTVTAGELAIPSADGRQMPSGVFARWAPH